MVKKLIALVAVVAVLLVGVGAAAYAGFISLPWAVPFLTPQTESSARYYPDDVLVYAWLTANPSMGQRANMMDVWDRLNDVREFRNFVEDVEDEVYAETGFDFEDDVLPWLGAEISAAVLDMDSDGFDVDAAVTIAVRNSDAAADFLADWLEFQEDEGVSDFDRDSINGFDVWVDEYNDIVYSLTPDLLVFATNVRTMEDVLNRVAGQDKRTLAEDEQFKEARNALPARRFASTYVDYQRLADVIGEDYLGLGLPLAGGSVDSCSQAFFTTPDWVMASAGWVDRGLVIDMVSPTGSDLLPTSSNVADAGEALPEDTLGFFSFSFDPDVDNWRNVLRECAFADLLPDWGDVFEEVNTGIIDLVELYSLLDEPMTNNMPALTSDSTLADALDLGLWTIDQLTGAHPEEDFLDYLTGDLILAVHDANVDFDALQPSDPNAGLVDAVAIISYQSDSESALRATVDGFLERLVTKPPEDFDVGAREPARIYDLERFHSEGYGLSPGYVFHDGYLTIGTTEKALTDTVVLQSGDGDPLSLNDEYSRAFGHLPDDRQSIMYVNVSRIMDRFDADGEFGDNDTYGTVQKAVSAIAISQNTDSDISRATLVLILFPDK